MINQLFNFNLFGRTVTITSYGLFLVLAIFLGISLLYYELKKRKLETHRIFDNILETIIGALVGARFIYVLLHLSFFIKNPRQIFYLWNGGLSLDGAIIGGFLVVFIWLYYKNRKNLKSWLDASMVAFTAASALGMLGPFLMLSEIGRPSSLPWAIQYEGVLRHPVSAYSVLAYLGLYAFLTLYQKRKNIPGQIFFLGLTLYSAVTFFIQFLQITDLYLFTAFSVYQLINLVILTLALLGLKYNQDLKFETKKHGSKTAKRI